MPKRPVTVWWTIPCKSAIPMFQLLMEQHDRDVIFVSLYDLPQFRKDLGWTVPPHGDLSIQVLDEHEWQEEADRILAERPGLHIVNGFYHDVRVRHVANRLALSGQDFGAIMEGRATWNPVSAG